MDKNQENKGRVRRRKISSDSQKKTSSQNRNITGRGSSTTSRNSNSSRTRSVSSSSRTKTSGRVSSSHDVNQKRMNPRARKRSSNKRKGSIRKSLTAKNIGIAILIIVLVGAASLGGLVFASLRNVKPVNEALLDKKTYQTTTIKYANGEKMTTAPSVTKKTPVPLGDISPYLKKAVVAIEDERFYKHGGVDIQGLGRSLVKTVFSRKKQGGSTIPMQVSKMLLTSSNQTISRKIKDIYYAQEMSKTVSKDKILETYLNNFFVGKGLAGAEAGARGYFSKSAKDLTLGESALLAGSTQNPAKYSAYSTARLDGNETKADLQNKLLFYVQTKDSGFAASTKLEMDMIEKINDWGLVKPEVYKLLKSGEMVVRKAVNNPEAIQRQRTVLAKMKELKMISEKEYTEAYNEQINIKLPEEEDDVASSVESMVEYAALKALKEQGNTDEEAKYLFYSGGLVINTTIDPKIQENLEKVYNNNDNFPNNKIGPNGVIQPQSAMVILDYKNGGIKGIIGGRNIVGRKTLNRATLPLQPGSTIKPLSVYTPAIDTMKLTQSTVFSDVRGGYRFPETRAWNPSTTTKGQGSMSMRKALALSSNTVAAKTAELLGDNYIDCCDIMIDYLKNFGVSSLSIPKSSNVDGDRGFGPLVLGGLDKGISPLEMASAYGTLANGGVYVEPHIITTITTFDGQLVVKNTPETHKVVDPGVAFVVSDMLKAVVTEGIGKRAALPGGMPTYGKTGSTNSYKDTWFVGFTPYYVGATYVADDQGVVDENGKVVPRRTFEGGGGEIASVVWQKAMALIHENLEAKELTKPSNVYFTRINPDDGGRSGWGSNAAFIEGTGPERSSYVPAPIQVRPRTQQNQQGTQGLRGTQGAQGGQGGQGGVQRQQQPQRQVQPQGQQPQQPAQQ